MLRPNLTSAFSNPQPSPLRLAPSYVQPLPAPPASIPCKPALRPPPAQTAARPARHSSGRRGAAAHPSASTSCTTSSNTCSSSWQPSSGDATARSLPGRAAAAAATAVQPAATQARTAPHAGGARQVARLPRPAGGRARPLPPTAHCRRHTTPRAPAGSAGWRHSSSSLRRACRAPARGQQMRLLPSMPSRRPSRRPSRGSRGSMGFTKPAPVGTRPAQMLGQTCHRLHPWPAWRVTASADRASWRTLSLLGSAPGASPPPPLVRGLCASMRACLQLLAAHWPHMLGSSGC